MFFNISDFILVSIITLLFYLNMPVVSKQVIYIPKGSTNYIITYLDKKGYDLNYIDKIIIRLIGYPQNGWIDLKQASMSKYDFLYKIDTSKAALKHIVLVPSETYYFFLKYVAQELNISQEKLFFYYDKYKYKKDGNILAETYLLPQGMDEEQLILHLFNYTNNQYKKYSLKIFGQYNQKNWYKYIIIASIIQKEAACVDEMTTISSVIYNRIQKHIKLQMDGTLNYAQYSHTPITHNMIKSDNSTYNTYKNYGIPTDPICAVNFDSIKAAIFPRDTQYLYFMKSLDGKKHNFSISYKQHIKNIRLIQKKRKIQKRKHSIKKYKAKKIKVKRKSKKKIKKVKKRSHLKDLWRSVQ